MEEIWKDIPGYEGLYQASNLGRIKSIYRYKKILIPYIDKNGYLRVRLYKNKVGTYKGIHKWVAETFIPNPNNFIEINHKNEIKTDNRVENLEWCNNLYNIHYGTGIERGTSKRSKKVKQYDLYNNTIKSYKSLSEASKINNIPIANIHKVCVGQRKTAGGYVWKFENIEKKDE